MNDRIIFRQLLDIALTTQVILQAKKEEAENAFFQTSICVDFLLFAKLNEYVLGLDLVNKPFKDVTVDFDYLGSKCF